MFLPQMDKLRIPLPPNRNMRFCILLSWTSMASNWLKNRQPVSDLKRGLTAFQTIVTFRHTTTNTFSNIHQVVANV